MPPSAWMTKHYVQLSIFLGCQQKGLEGVLHGFQFWSPLHFQLVVLVPWPNCRRADDL
jgi:hypothetical protein